MNRDAGDPDRIDWTRISLFGVGGVALTLCGALIRWDYLQSVIVNLGTTVFLFGYIWVAEQRLGKRIDALSKPTTLADAQLQARSALRALSKLNEDLVSRDELIETSLTTASARIMHAGFAQQRPAAEHESIRMYHYDASVKWDLERTGDRLRHHIKFPDGGEFVTDSIDIGSDKAVEDLRHSLRQFEDQVFHGLLVIIEGAGLRDDGRGFGWRARG
ncbi:hypothetical protein EV385_1894 [Krasilnikovia cinnamomea]|uniref:Uncharacterized protein n=1 Tax=Krasilnikovia cinnamomea TaxID=349313 RepID=A0A4Q7ZJ22_9ACTN|nr:hypothetical protein [Krasilnikovia cinnamomea]RZU50129.1 hypothetical protein EV385_1894 [Krasilnikovia cinnamomea]